MRSPVARHLYWLRHRLFWRQAIAIEALPQDSVVDDASIIACPFGNGFRLAPAHDLPVGASVLGLLRERDKPTVGWLIVPIVVDPLNGQIVPISMSQRPIAERREVCQPFRTDRDAAPAVMPVGGIGRVQASTLHTPPDVVQSRACSTMGATTSADKFLLQTTTRVGPGADEIGDWGLKLSAAITSDKTRPIPAPTWADASAIRINHNETVETLTRGEGDATLRKHEKFTPSCATPRAALTAPRHSCAFSISEGELL